MSEKYIDLARPMRPVRIAVFWQILALVFSGWRNRRRAAPEGAIIIVGL
jgi:hypothetical protein